MKAFADQPQSRSAELTFNPPQTSSRNSASDGILTILRFGVPIVVLGMSPNQNILSHGFGFGFGVSAADLPRGLESAG